MILFQSEIPRVAYKFRGIQAILRPIKFRWTLSRSLQHSLQKPAKH